MQRFFISYNIETSHATIFSCRVVNKKPLCLEGFSWHQLRFIYILDFCDSDPSVLVELYLHLYFSAGACDLQESFNRDRQITYSYFQCLVFACFLLLSKHWLFSIFDSDKETFQADIFKLIFMYAATRHALCFRNSVVHDARDEC